MSSLQKQLASLVGSSPNVSKLRNASILFDENELQKITLQTIFSIGRNGFIELAKINSQFVPYEKTLFSQSSVQFNRQLQTKEENKKLDIALDKFLHLLSSYLLLKSSQKAFEYLIRRYHIQVYNVDSIMACILPFHATHIFTRILRILELNNTKWEFLKEVQKHSEDGINRSFIVQHIIKNNDILSFIIDNTKNCIESCDNFSTYLVFCTVVIIEVIETISKLKNSIITTILPFLDFGIKYTKKSSVQTACYMIISQISSKTSFSSSLLDHFLSTSIQYGPSIPSDTFTLLIHLCQTQKIEEFSDKFMNDVLNIDNLISILNDLSDKYNCFNFINLIIKYLLNHIEGENHIIISDLLYTFILEYVNINKHIPNIINQILKIYLDLNKKLKDKKNNYQKIISIIEKRFSLHFNNSITNMFTDINKLSNDDKNLAKKKLLILSSLQVNDIRHKPMINSGTSLYFSFKHTNPTIRYEALSTLIELKNKNNSKKENNDKESFNKFYSEILLDLLYDDNENIIKLVLTAPDMIILCDSNKLYKRLISLFNQEIKKNSLISIDIISLLCDSFIKQYPLFKNKLLSFIFSNLSWTNSKNIKIQKKILESSELLDKSIFKGFKNNKIDINNNTKNERIKINEWIINTIINNIISSKKLLNELIIILKDDIKNNTYIRFIFSLLLNKISKDKKQLFELLEIIITGTELFYKSNSIINNINLKKSYDVISCLDNFEKELSSFILFTLISNIPCDLNYLKISKILLKLNDNNIPQLTMRLLTILIDSPSPTIIASYLKEFLAVQPGFKVFQYFSLFWMNGEKETNLSNNRRIRALNLTNILLHSFSQYDSIIYQYFLPSIIINLIYPNINVRHAAISCLFTIKKVLENPGKQSFKAIFYSTKDDKNIYNISFDVFNNFIIFLTNNSKIFKNDPNSIKSLISSYLLSNDKLNDIINYFISHICATPHPAISCGLYDILKLSNNSPILENCHGLLITIKDNIEDEINQMNDCYHIYELLQIKNVLSLYNDSVSSDILNNSKVIESIIHILHLNYNFNCKTFGYEQKENLCLLALNQITHNYYSCLNENNQTIIFNKLCDILHYPSIHCREKVKVIIKELYIPSKIIAKQLLLSSPKLNKKSPITEPKKKKRRTLENNNNNNDDNNNNEDYISRKLESLTLLLELLQTKNNFESSNIILLNLFNLLDILTDDNNIISQQIGTEYTIQLILTTIRNITNLYITQLKKNDNSLDIKVIEKVYDISKVIRCISSNRSPQTHNKAFLLLASVTRIFPDRVLKHAMPIFTIMGDQSMRSDDNYTFQVLHKTIQAIIPRIAEQQPNQVIPIIKIFVDSFLHIPAHRRLVLFGSFIKNFGMKYFHIILILLFQIHSTKSNTFISDIDFTNEDLITSFCFNLLLQFSPLQVIPAVTRIIQDLTNWKQNPKKSSSILTILLSSLGKLFDYYNILSITCQFIGKYLKASNFYKQYIKLSPLHSKQIQKSFITLFESIMFQLRLSSSIQHKLNDDEALKCKYIVEYIYNIIDLLNDLLHIDGFIDFISDLIQHNDPQIRRKSLLLLNEKIDDFEGDFEEYDIKKFIELVDKISNIIKSNKLDNMDIDNIDSNTNNETSINQQTALYSLEILTRHFGNKVPDSFISILPAIIDCLDNNDDQVKASAIICIATNCLTIGMNTLSYLPKFYPKILQILDESLINNDNNTIDTHDDGKLLLIMSSLSSIEVSIRNLSNFISPYLNDTFLILLQSNLLEHTNSLVLDKLNILFPLIIKKVKTRKIINSIINIYDNMIKSIDKHSYISFQKLFEVFGNTCKQITNSKISVHYPKIVKFYINVFDFRITIQDNISYKHCLLVEDTIIDSLISFILKLNEILFKPLFLKLKDWSSIDIQPFTANRKVLFYKFVDKLTTSLNVVLVPLFVYLLDDMISILKKPELLLFSKGEQNNIFEFKQPATSICTELLFYVIHSLGQCFEYNEIKFITKERFEMILDPLVSTIEYYEHPYINYDKIIPQIVYSIGQLAVTVNNQLLWKPLQNRVLMHTRNEEPKIRFSSLLVLQEFYQVLGEEFLPMLPESIPYIAELIEDEDEKVEQLCHDVIGQIDEFLGDEKIEDYL